LVFTNEREVLETHGGMRLSHYLHGSKEGEILENGDEEEADLPPGIGEGEVLEDVG
jgi:hypothetical protein